MMQDMQQLGRLIRECTEIEGAAAAGIATLETLAGGPPTADLTYILPEARAAVSFAVGMDPAPIRGYLAKEDRIGLEREMIQANAIASGIGLHLANFLSQKGFPSRAVAANNVFRPMAPGRAEMDYVPELAHRYLAVRSGVGHLGLSGNLITASHGAAVILGAVVTAAPIPPTRPLPPEDSYCDSCRLCMASCAARFMDPKKTTSVALGGETFSYSARRDVSRCDLVCSGFTGLHPSGKWSTWSPGRFAIPDDDEALHKVYDVIVKTHLKWPQAPGGRYFFYSNDKMHVSCANCQLVCHPDKSERHARFNLLTRSGVVVQDEKGGLSAVSPDQALRILNAMPLERRRLYEEV